MQYNLMYTRINSCNVIVYIETGIYLFKSFLIALNVTDRLFFQSGTFLSFWGQRDTWLTRFLKYIYWNYLVVLLEIENVLLTLLNVL